jgi:Na+/glutamate symporter
MMFAQQKLSKRLTRTARGTLAALAIISIVLAIVLVSPIPVSASLSIDEPIAIYTIDFTGFTGTGFTPEPGAGQLD